MNTALIQHLETLPKEHLEIHLAAYPWFAAARAVLAKKESSQALVQQTVPYVKNRVWFKNYLLQTESAPAKEKETVEVATPAEAILYTPNEQSIAIEVDNTLAEAAAPLNLNLIAPPTPETELVDSPAIEHTETQLQIEAETTDVDLVESAAHKTSVEAIEPPAIQEENIAEQSFSGWLAHFSTEKDKKIFIAAPAPKAKEEKPKKDELEMLIQSNIPYTALENKIEAETHYSKGLSDFIATQKRQKKQQLPSPDFDENSRLPITETIAVLLEKQGKTKQAILVYEQLCLKFPLKSTYFAAHIQKLKQKI
ncbi:MAG: hypothetical protein KF872_08930 [Chitinophagales bacterium]|nr:hypothetical protein [Chitinophagales bacterium]